MFERSIEPILQKALARSRVVLLYGARQVGKTTLTRDLLKDKNYTYLTFDDELTYLAAKKNPAGFIADIKKPVVLDEVQRVPELFLAIKKDVDMDLTPGRYLLTGSANPLLIPTLGDSLAGRMEVINLMPLSQGELAGKEENFIENVFTSRQLSFPDSNLSKQVLYKKIIVGGYPGLQLLDDEGRDVWMRNYINLLLQRDVKELAQIEKLTELPNLLKIFSARASNLLNVAEVARDVKMVAKTVYRYLALFETIFLVNLQLSWSTNIAQRFIKSPKIYLVDSGLLAYLLDINIERALANSTHMGRVLENFVVGELQKQATWSKPEVKLYHCRTTGGEEVDIVLEDRSGNIVGIEVKCSERVSHDDLKGLKYIQAKVKDKFIKGIVLYTGTACVPFGDNLYALPISALWE